MNKHFTAYSKKNEGIDESSLPEDFRIIDYYLTIVYSNSEIKGDDAKIEFR